MLSLIQDAGRFGFHGIGLTTGGPMDALAFRWANRLLGNDIAATMLEVTIGGLELEAEVATQLVVTGADIALTINGQPRATWQTHSIKAGDTIALGFTTAGSRVYLAVAGGFQVTPQFGSTATVVRESVGGLAGSALVEGDFLSCAEVNSKQNRRLAEFDRPRYDSDIEVRVIPSYQQKHFDDLQQLRFFNSEYTVSQRCDRMGYRLEGAEVSSDIDGILSEGICYGAIQVPADGQPIVLLNDRQTIGGYPKIGSALSMDAARLAQLAKGGKVHFRAISPYCAHNELLLAENRFAATEIEPC
ncbi:MAG: biotin-dependent carboxylase-like uncharacterized protein [Oceanicoccus sp.]|jgi:biotin-dependent carboxylase-like uncharacterized protein